jgi:hypothetical protein
MVICSYHTHKHGSGYTDAAHFPPIPLSISPATPVYMDNGYGVLSVSFRVAAGVYLPEILFQAL